jgi:predicted dehydrogenase
MDLQVALIGASHWHAPRYLEALHEAGARLVAVSDPDFALARLVADQWGCHAYADHLQLLEATRPDLVFAMPRHCDAAAVARDLLESGLPAVFEKPLGLDASQVAPLVELAARKGSYAAVPFILRYGPLWEQVSRAEESGGAATYADFRLVNGPSARYTQAHSGWMLDPRQSGGGPIRNLGIHAADGLLRLAGTTAASLEVVSARLTFGAHDVGIEDHGLAMLAASSGLLASIEAGNTYPAVDAGMGPGGDREWRVVIGDTYLIERDDSCIAVTPAGRSVLPSLSGAERYRRFVHETVAGFRRNTPPLATIRDCFLSMRLIDAIYESAEAPWISRSDA